MEPAIRAEAFPNELLVLVGFHLYGHRFTLMANYTKLSSTKEEEEACNVQCAVSISYRVHTKVQNFLKVMVLVDWPIRKQKSLETLHSSII